MATVTTSQATGTQLEAWGTHCQHPQCGLGDFLPFTCPYCSLKYCSSHRLPFSHSCLAYTQSDSQAADVRATPCPLCSQPLPLEKVGGRDADINTAMEAHLDGGDCAALKGQQANGLLSDSHGGGEKKRLQKAENQCKYGRCTNRMWVEMRCEKCRKQFCPTHREPKSHKCERESASASTSSSNLPFKPAASSSTLPSSTSSKLNKTFTSSTSPSATFKTTIPSLNLSKLKSSLPPTATSSSTSSHTIPNQPSSSSRTTSRRAAQERASALQGLKNRAAKGLLSEDEKVKYATMQALEAKKGKGGGQSDGKDCVVS